MRGDPLSAKLPPQPQPPRSHVLSAAGLAGVRVMAVTLAALMLSFAGQLSLPLTPWNAIALPAGLAVAVAARWGRQATMGAVLGTLLALVGSGLDVVAVTTAVAAVALMPLLTQPLLQRLGFERRLERAADIAALTLAVAVAGALPGALLVAIWVTAAPATHH